MTSVWKYALFCVILFSSISLADETAQKIPVPDAAALKEPIKLVNEAYLSSVNAAKTTDQKMMVVNKLIDAGKEESNYAARFALLLKARDVAIDAGDVEAVFRVIDQIDGTYQVDALRMKVDAARFVNQVTRDPQQQQKLAEAAGATINNALAADRYDIARSLAEIAVSSAHFANDPDLQRDAAAKEREVRNAETAYGGIKTALVKLADNPNDPIANLKIGKFRCFFKGDWDGGFPMLALGSDPTLKELAIKEIAGATTTDEQVKLGDGWWTAAERESGDIRILVQKRATKWYGESLPNLTGLVKATVEARLKSFDSNETVRNVNLLKLVDVNRDAVVGKWEFRNGTLVTDGTPVPTPEAKIEFLYKVPTEYDYRVVLERRGIRDEELLCRAMGHQFLFVLSTYNNTALGFEVINGKFAGDNPTTRRSNASLESGRRYACIVKVRKDRVQAFLDDKLVTEWKTDYSDISLRQDLNFRRGDTIGLLCGDPTVIYSAEIVEITGKGQKLK